MSQQEANRIAFDKTKHCYIDSMMNMEGIEEYFMFNAHACRSYAAVLNRFRGTLLSEDLIVESIPNRRTNRQKRNFTEVFCTLSKKMSELYRSNASSKRNCWV